MDITGALGADLAVLTDALRYPTADPMATVTDTVLLLAADARAAVPSFLGLTMSIAGHETGTTVDRVVLQFTLLDGHVDPRDIGTSLRLPRPIAGVGTDRPGITVVLYAATPGAFVDMAADLSFLTGHEFAVADLDQHRGLAHEADITGVLQAEGAIHEAIGVLIDRGHTPEQASTELDTLADAAHTDRATAAAGILTALPRR